MFRKLKQFRFRRKHLTRTMLWLGIMLMGFDAATAWGLHWATHLSHMTGATGATLAGLADALETVAAKAI